MIQAAESDIHDASASPFDISIIGSGLTGLQIAVGLAKRNIRVCIYEQASELRNIGAGVAFNAHFEECMNALDPRIAAILPEIAIKSNRPLHYVDASKKEESLNLQGLINTGNDNNKESDNSVLSDTNVPLKDHTWGCHRAHMIDKLVKLLPAGCLRLGKRLDTIERNGDKVVLNFSDGSKVNTDAVIGTDGVKSRLRYLLLHESNPSAARANYAFESASWCVVDMDKVDPILGRYARNMVCWIGHGAHIVTYPIADNRYLNLVAYIRDKTNNDSGLDKVQTTKQEIAESFSEFSITVCRLIDQIPDELNRWAMFDTLEHPLPTYAIGPIALAGDAAHASTPHLGGGAGMGVEDALVLVTLLEKASEESVTGGKMTTTALLSLALQVYDSIRRQRSQWLVAGSRRQGRLSKWEIPDLDINDLISETIAQTDRIYYYDWKAMLEQSIQEFERRVNGNC